MKKALTWTIASVLLLTAAFFLGVPYLARVGSPMGEGSFKHARRWKDQLLAYHSLDEAKRDFNCHVMRQTRDGGLMTLSVSDTVRGRPRALLQGFPDGRWVICAHASSHGQPGGGTIVTRDDAGTVRVFFGHVCGSIFTGADTLDEFYAELRTYNGVTEVSLDATAP